MVPRQPNEKKHTSSVFIKHLPKMSMSKKTSGWDFNALSFLEVSYLRFDSHLRLVPTSRNLQTKQRLAVKLRRIQQDINNLDFRSIISVSGKI